MMKNRKTDRRSERTQRLLGGALVSLLLEKRFDAITIQDIVDRANVGRSTFYEHYWDKEDLLTSEIERLIDMLSQQITTDQKDVSVFIPSRALFEHIQDHQCLYQALQRGRGIEIVMRALHDHLRTQAEIQLREAHKEKEYDDLLSVVASYVAGSFVALMQWWLETEMTCSPERMESLFRGLVLPGVKCILVVTTQVPQTCQRERNLRKAEE
jgi:AcrR family transcriptional regulator